MVLLNSAEYEVGVANRLCVNPYDPIPLENTVPYAEPVKSQSIVLPVVLVILAIVFCLACVVGIPVIAYIYK